MDLAGLNREGANILGTGKISLEEDPQLGRYVPAVKNEMNLFAKLGAVTYVLWGLLHLQAARLVYMLGQSLEPGIVQGRIYQDAWNLLFFALFGIIVAVFLNWKNSRLGFWLNLTVVSAADIGFIVAVLIPGYVPLVPGGLGPLLWVLAVLFSTLGILNARRETAGA